MFVHRFALLYKIRFFFSWNCFVRKPLIMQLTLVLFTSTSRLMKCLERRKRKNKKFEEDCSGGWDGISKYAVRITWQVNNLFLNYPLWNYRPKNGSKVTELPGRRKWIWNPEQFQTSTTLCTHFMLHMLEHGNRVCI